MGLLLLPCIKLVSRKFLLLCLFEYDGNCEKKIECTFLIPSVSEAINLTISVKVSDSDSIAST